MSGKFKIAVTGGFGSGKSTACRLLEEKGYPVISADALGKDLLQNNPEVRRLVIKEFGQDSYKGNEPDKNYLSGIVFDDENELKKLNAIIHPRTIKLIENEMEKALQESDMVFVESALIFEAKREENFDNILLITADEELRIKRLQERQNISRTEIERRIKNQLTEEEKRKRSDFVIENNGDIADLDKKIDFILMVIRSQV